MKNVLCLYLLSSYGNAVNYVTAMEVSHRDFDSYYR